MKINTLLPKLTVFFLLLAPHLFLAQVGINSTGATPSADAMLDVKSSNKGVLIPRLSSSSLIPSPTLGLIFYNTTTNQFNYYNGSSWIAITNAANATGWSVNGNDIFNSNTGNVGIGTATPKAPFNVAAGKTVLWGADSSGAGSKFLWYPSKSAFRAGYATGNEWDYANVGAYSTALGYGTNASPFCTALGNNTTASGFSYVGFPPVPNAISTAMGSNTTASGLNSTAMGQGTTASGSGAIAIGNGATASGPITISMGYQTAANNDFSIAIGTGTIASGKYSTAMGLATIASTDTSTVLGAYNLDVSHALLMVGNGKDNANRSNAITVMKDGKTGIGTTPKATFNVAAGKTVLFGADSSGVGNKLIWYPSKSAFRAGYTSGSEWNYANVGIFSTALGYITTANGQISTAMGSTTTASGSYSTAMGSGTIASGVVSTAMGAGSNASGNWSTAMGYLTIASGSNSTAMGTYNIDVPTALFMD